MNELIFLIIFFPTFVSVYLLLTHIEYKMWEDWFTGKNSWWNILYKNRWFIMTNIIIGDDLVKLMICMCLQRRGLTDEELEFLKRMEHQYFYKGDDEWLNYLIKKKHY